MRRRFGLLMPSLLTGLLLLAGCSTGGDLAVEIVPNADFEGDVYTFTATGDAVNDGIFCDSGGWIWLGNETVDGDPMPNSMIEELVSAGADFEMVVVNQFECADGSGSVVVEELSTVNASNPAGSAEDAGTVVGTWEVRSGSVNEDQITGSGDLISEGNMQVSGSQRLLNGTLTSG
jgi:hypothetical protein